MDEELLNQAKLNALAKTTEAAFPGTAFSIAIFPVSKSGQASYISNANRKDMIGALETLLDELKEEERKDTNTFNMN